MHVHASLQRKIVIWIFILLFVSIFGRLDFFFLGYRYTSNFSTPTHQILEGFTFSDDTFRIFAFQGFESSFKSLGIGFNLNFEFMNFSFGNSWTLSFYPENKDFAWKSSFYISYLFEPFVLGIWDRKPFVLFKLKKYGKEKISKIEILKVENPYPGEKLQITLKAYENSKPAEYEDLKINIWNKSYTVKTNEFGIANLKIDIPKNFNYLPFEEIIRISTDNLKLFDNIKVNYNSVSKLEILKDLNFLPGTVVFVNEIFKLYDNFGNEIKFFQLEENGDIIEIVGNRILIPFDVKSGKYRILFKFKNEEGKIIYSEIVDFEIKDNSFSMGREEN